MRGPKPRVEEGCIFRGVRRPNSVGGHKALNRESPATRDLLKGRRGGGTERLVEGVWAAEMKVVSLLKVEKKNRQRRTEVGRGRAKKDVGQDRSLKRGGGGRGVPGPNHC